LHHLLTNAVYFGKVKYKKELHDGEHQAIVDPLVWQQVQDVLRQQSNGRVSRTESHALLKGILRCQPCGFAMTPTFAAKPGGPRYRFYTCVNALKRGRQACSSRYLPAKRIESMVIEQIQKLALDHPSSTSAADDPLVRFSDLSAWGTLAPDEQARLVHRIVQRVEYDGRQGKVAITFHAPNQQNSNGAVFEPRKENER